MFKFSCCSFNTKENEEKINSFSSITKTDTMSTAYEKSKFSTNSLQSEFNQNAEFASGTGISFISPKKKQTTKSCFSGNSARNGFEIKQSTEATGSNHKINTMSSTQILSNDKSERKQRAWSQVTFSKTELNQNCNSKFKLTQRTSCFNFSYENDELSADTALHKDIKLYINSIKGNYLKDTNKIELSLEQCDQIDEMGWISGVKIGDSFKVKRRKNDFMIIPILHTNNIYIKIDSEATLAHGNIKTFQINKQEIEWHYKNNNLEIWWNEKEHYIYRNINGTFSLNIGKDPSNNIINKNGVDLIITSSPGKELIINNKNKKHNMYNKVIDCHIIEWGIKEYLKVNSCIIEWESH